MVMPDQGLKRYGWYAHRGRERGQRIPQVLVKLIRSFPSKREADQFAAELSQGGILYVRVRRYTIYNGTKEYWGVYAPDRVNFPT